MIHWNILVGAECMCWRILFCRDPWRNLRAFDGYQSNGNREVSSGYGDRNDFLCPSLENCLNISILVPWVVENMKLDWMFFKRNLLADFMH
ncbi:hypothetical protein TNIN_205881 [Trichonephila inaurata madagascariensis]|uniref:Uncharacterized protein n=1 Tax=Trichonephila inaurata madagascariensis TaxID=2747483 RepID=A0A8X6IBX2_9ARAC|nr:hypothetical protein TNIN_205881 [Trichonephila inaurata madagascariensis]